MRRKLRSAARWAVGLGGWALGLGVLVVLLGAGAALGIFAFSQGEGPPSRGTLSAAGLGKPAHISRDPFGVPHITAERDHDAFFALGVAHAQDRLWQMEVLRRSASGTLSEVFGPATVREDRLARTLGLRLAAEAEVERLPAKTIELLERYADGVNAWIAALRRHDAPLPFEFRWLSLEPADWSVADSIAIVRLRSWMLGRSLSSSLLLKDLLDVGSDVVEPFLPVRPVDGRAELVSGLLDVGATADRLAGHVGMRGPVGSLGFVVGARRSASGQPLLANDPHMEFQLPALFYLAHLEAPGLELSGATWPGVPIFWTGTNRSIAWGQVALHASTSDLFLQTRHPDDPHQYERNRRWLRAETRTEQIDVRFGRGEEIEVVTTRHGPLLASVHPDDVKVHDYAIKWTGQAKRSGVEELLAIQRARSWETFRSALREYVAPAATFLFAHADGGIGTQLAGDLPVRSIKTGLFPATGDDRYYDWRGFVPFDELPSEFGEELGWLVASTYVEPKKLDAPVYWLWRTGGGADRVSTLLREGKRLTLEDVTAIQTDRRSARGPAGVRRLLADTEHVTGGAAQLRQILLEWDGETDIHSMGASVYHVFRQLLARRVLEEQRRIVEERQIALESQRRGLLGGHKRKGIDIETVLSASEPVPGAMLARFLDRVGPEQSAVLMREVLEESWRWLGVHVHANPQRWTWGELHRVRLTHPFERLGWGIERWLGRRLGRGPFPVPGDPDSVWTMHHLSLPSTHVGVGPVLRYAVDLGDPDHARYGLAGGQSGHPGSARYDDAVADWMAGRSRPLWMHAGNIEYFAEGTWDLLPGDDTPYP